MPTEAQRVEAAIRSLLEEHVKAPLFNVREADYRSALVQKLRDKLEGAVSVVLKKNGDDSRLPMNDACREKAITSRVHSEIRLREKGTKREQGKKDRQTYDIVVLKNKSIVLRVKQSGADALERVELDDVAVVIEIKAAPSNRQHKKFEEDIEKLRNRNLGDARRILVVIDKSILLSLPEIGGKKPNASWRESLKKRRKKSTDVEVWFLDDRKPARMFAIRY